MKNKPIYQTIIIFFIMILAYALCADKDPQNKLTKKGSMEYKSLWTKKDVINFLKLPYSQTNTSIRRISFDKFYYMQGISDFANISNKITRLEPNNASLGGITFRLCDSELQVYGVNMYNPRTNNAACDSILNYITSSLSMWSDAPNIYEPHIKNGIYTLLTKGTRPQKLYFDTKKIYIVQVEYDFSQIHKKLDNKEITTKIDKIIKNLIAIINNHKTEPTTQQTEYIKIRQKYKRAKDKSPK